VLASTGNGGNDGNGGNVDGGDDLEVAFEVESLQQQQPDVIPRLKTTNLGTASMRKTKMVRTIMIRNDCKKKLLHNFLYTYICIYKNYFFKYQHKLIQSNGIHNIGKDTVKKPLEQNC
jgi:hypothetical protein